MSTTVADEPADPVTWQKHPDGYTDALYHGKYIAQYRRKGPNLWQVDYGTSAFRAVAFPTEDACRAWIQAHAAELADPTKRDRVNTEPV